MLIRAASIELDIDSEEIDIASIHSRNISDRRAVGEILLSDHLQNGAGFVEWIKDNWNELIDGFVKRKGNISGFSSGQLPCSCSKGCYKCLMTFRNRQLHGLLDWRLAYDFFLLLAGEDKLLGLTGENPWTDPSFNSMNGVREQVSGICSQFPELREEKNYALPAFGNAQEGELFFVGHPFWSGESVEGSVVDAAIEAASGRWRGIRLMDSFNLQRRKTWCWNNREVFPLIHNENQSDSNIESGLTITELPESEEFELPELPPGMPPNKKPLFRKLGENADFSLRHHYLVGHRPSNRFIVARISTRTSDAENISYKATPQNCGISPFDINPEDILAILK